MEANLLLKVGGGSPARGVETEKPAGSDPGGLGVDVWPGSERRESPNGTFERLVMVAVAGVDLG